MDLDRWLEDARPEVPEGLAGRMIAGARGAESQSRVFWVDLERTARRALGWAAAAAVVTVALAVSTLFAGTAPDNARTASLVDLTVQQQLDQYEEAP
jgi:hypothetical protein